MIDLDGIQLHHGDCRQVLASLPDCSVDSVVTDPPYELGFMGKAWDGSGIAYSVEMWAEVLRVLKPGGHLCAFGGTRTYHRMACAIEDAGFEIRDSLHWVYGSGFPKSLDVSKAIDKRPGVSLHLQFARHLAERRQAAGLSRADVSEQVVGTRSGACWNWEHHQFPEAKWWPALRDLLQLDSKWSAIIDEAEREVVGKSDSTLLAVAPGEGRDRPAVQLDITTAATDAAKQWEGWGTALKPAHEPIVLARRPLIGTVAANVLTHGTGALNIDGARVEGQGAMKWASPRGGIWTTDSSATADLVQNEAGRWPANVIFDTEAGALLDEQADGASRFFTAIEWDDNTDLGIDVPFRYVPKPSKQERNAGLDGLPAVFSPTMNDGIGGKPHNSETATPKQNHHPTVKPLALMRWLVRLVTPTGGTVLEPFAGSGTTLMACVLEGFNGIGIEMTDEYLPIIEGRVRWAQHQPPRLFL